MKYRRNPFLLCLLLVRLVLILVWTMLLFIPLVLGRLAGTAIPHGIAVLWGKGLLLLFGIRSKTTGTIKLSANQPCLFVCNHLSFLDIPLLLALLDRPFRFMADDSIFRIPWFGVALGLCGYIRVPQGRPKAVAQALQRAADYIQQGMSVLLFHEGGINRSRDKSNLWRIQFGLLRILKQTTVPLQPLVLWGTDQAMENITALFQQVGCSFAPDPLPAHLVLSLERPRLGQLLTRINQAQYRVLEQVTAGKPDCF